MLIQSLPASRFRSRLISGVHARTDLTALAIACLSALPIQGITAHSASSGPSVSSTSNVGNAMGTTRLSGGRMFSSARRLRTRLSIPALIPSSDGNQQQLECDVIVGPGADANGMMASGDLRRSLIIAPTIVYGTYLGGTGLRHDWCKP